jgi:hypothetical protein
MGWLWYGLLNDSMSHTFPSPFFRFPFPSPMLRTLESFGMAAFQDSRLFLFSSKFFFLHTTEKTGDHTRAPEAILEPAASPLFECGQIGVTE